MVRIAGTTGVVVTVVALLMACRAGLPVDDPSGDETPAGDGTSGAGVDTLQAGDLVITEVMQNPAQVSDADGEWFEVFVASTEEVDLQGLEVSDNGSDSFSVGSSLVVQPGSYVVFGNSGDASTNGGVTVDFVYGAAMTLSNADDEIVLTNGSGEIDRVDYDGGPGFPDPTGASMQLDPDHRTHTGNDSGANWCESTVSFGEGDSGTPGATNEECP